MDIPNEQFISDQLNEAFIEDEVQEMEDLANSIVQGLKERCSCSSLETAIFLFHEAFSELPVSHPLQSYFCNDLASALVTRFFYRHQNQDLLEAIALHIQVLQSLDLDPEAATLINTLAAEWDSAESLQKNQLAKATLTQFHESAPSEDLNTVIFLREEVLRLRPKLHSQHTVSTQNLAAAFYARFCNVDDIKDLDRAILLLREVASNLQNSEQNGPGLLDNLSGLFVARFCKTGHFEDLQEAFICQNGSINAEADVGHSYGLATQLPAQFQESGHSADLDKSIQLLRDAIARYSAPGPHRNASLINLAIQLRLRFNQSYVSNDLDEAISLFQEALELLPAAHLNRYICLDHLTLAFQDRFRQSNKRGDLDEVISLYGEFLKLQPAPHLGRAASLNSLASAHEDRFRLSGEIKDLDEAIAFFGEMQKLLPKPHPDRYKSLNNLAAALDERFRQLKDHKDIDEAISHFREALEQLKVSHPHRFLSLNHLATSLLHRFRQSGQQPDLDEIISLFREALELQPASYPDRSSSLGFLASALSDRYTILDNFHDLEEAISLYQEALKLRAAPHPDRYTYLSNLGSALNTRYIRFGRRQDLDEGISLTRESLELRPAPYPERLALLRNLSLALQSRFNESGELKDIDEAISLLEEVLKRRPAPHPDRPMCLSSLALALLDRSRQIKTGVNELAEAAMSLQREALELLPRLHPDRWQYLCHLANSLQGRSILLARREDLEDAISIYREVLNLETVPHRSRTSTLINLAVALRARFGLSGKRRDLEEAIVLSHESLAAVVSSHPDMCRASSHLAGLYALLYQQTQERAHLEKAVSGFRAAVRSESAPVSERFRVAKDWAAALSNDDELALEAYETAIELLPRLSMVGMDLKSRQQALTMGSDGLSRDSAACATRLGRYDRAIELLEQARSVFWSQALQLRTPTDELRDVAPDLERELSYISMALEQGSHRDIPNNMMDNTEKITVEKDAARFIRLNEQWLQKVAEVRELDGFRDFLRPARFATLMKSAIEHPVVVLNAGTRGCDALIMSSSSTNVQHVPLPGLSFQDVQSYTILLRAAVASGGGPIAPFDSKKGERTSTLEDMKIILQSLGTPFEDRLGRRVADASLKCEDVFRGILALLWVKVAKPVIDSLGLKKSLFPLRVRWCSTGPFAFLPIHAAGFYHPTGYIESAFDYIISSYTPTISGLLTSKTRPFHTDPFKMMVVIQPDTPNYGALRHTIDELRGIEKHLPSTSLDTFGTAKSPANVNDVISRLPAASIVHFACHGEQNLGNPLESALILQDGRLKVSQIMSQRMPNASLAFLDACQTAMGDETLPDEAIHLAASLLFAGFDGVVATMWSIADIDGPKVTNSFYEHILHPENWKSAGGSIAYPDTTEAACALHIAVSELRRENVSFMRWVPFIHLGV